MLKNPLQYSIGSLLFVTFLVAIGLTVGPTTWFLIAVFECGLFFVLIRILDGNVPEVVQKRMQMNAMRADGTNSPKREKIEKLERSRFKLNLMVLVFVFFAATNVGLLTLRVDRLFEGETYLVDSPEVQVRPGRKISEAQYAMEIGRMAQAETHESPSLQAGVRFTVLAVAGSVWLLTLVLIPVGYLGMLRSLAWEANDRTEQYRSIDYVRETEKA